MAPRREPEHVSETLVRGDEYRTLRLSISENIGIAVAPKTDISHVERLVSGLAQRHSRWPGHVFID